MLEETGQDAAGAERVGLEGDEDQDGRGERVPRVEEVEVGLGDERAWEVHFRG